MVRRVVDGKVDGAQPQVLTFLGERWGMGAARFSNEQAVAWTRKLARAGVVLTLDTPIQKGGLISQPFLDQLRAIGKGVEAP